MAEVIDYSTIFDATYNSIIVVNKKMIIVLINKAAVKLLGRSQQDIVGQKIETIIPNTRLPEVIATGIPLRGERMILDGHQVVTNRTPIWQNGEITGAIAEFQDYSDVDDLASQLDSVKEMNKELEGLIEAVDDGIVVSDGKGYIIRVNKAYQHMTGITADEYVGKHVKELLKAGYIGRTTSDIVIEHKMALHVTDIRNNKELLLTSVPVLNEIGDVVRVVTVFRDLAELNNLKKQLAQLEKMELKYQQELTYLRSEQVLKTIVTNNSEMKEKIELAFRVARVNSTVLILGESGTGKELFAQLIHRASTRSCHPFIKINCGAMPETLLESELFGYDTGTFTGAAKEGKAGLLEIAHGGTLFLDEIAELPLSLQVKLLRAIQEREIRRVGGKKTLSVDVRFVAATNRNLEEMIRNKLFREDLYYRLNVVPLTLPPLRERKEDIFLLTAEFLDRINKQYGWQKWLHPDLVRSFLNYNWPGNVRELQNIIERLVVTSREDCLGLDLIYKLFPDITSPERLSDVCKDAGLLRATVENEERKILLEVYTKAGSTRKAAKMLGISQSGVVKKLKKYGISK
jgi:PAS domain S-box-containing protein/TyrR family helix-turn-helix protein